MIVGRASAHTKEQWVRQIVIYMQIIMETSGRRRFPVSRTRQETHVAMVRSNKAHSCICNKAIFIKYWREANTKTHNLL